MYCTGTVLYCTGTVLYCTVLYCTIRSVLAMVVKVTFQSCSSFLMQLEFSFIFSSLYPLHNFCIGVLFDLNEVVTAVDCIVNEEAIFWEKNRSIYLSRLLVLILPLLKRNMCPMPRGIIGGEGGGGPF